jgi:NAD kinase
MAGLSPRIVFATRESDYERLLARHGTREQARFFLQTRGQKLDDVEQPHAEYLDALRRCRAATPADWRQATIGRADFDRFLFAPEDIVVAVGQDGLVANIAKYLNGQPVLGVNPSPKRYDGVLVRLAATQLDALLPAAQSGNAKVQKRTMVEARLDNGERLLALNEIFIGHRSHQSARYHIQLPDGTEEHSSSGLIVASGTGATGWARSIQEATGQHFTLAPEERAIVYLVREPFPSVSTGTALRGGKLAGASLSITSHMGEGGVIFADGIESDFVGFDWGRQVQLAIADRALQLVVGAE